GIPILSSKRSNFIAMVENILANISDMLQNNMWLVPLLAFAAGVLTSFTPCSLSSIPLVINFVGGSETKPKRAFCLSLVFALGSTATFTALGAAASLLGGIMEKHETALHVVLGVLMILMALQTWDIIHFIPSTALLTKNKKHGYLGAFLAGILGGIFSSHCATPVLVALLSVAAGSGNVLFGVFLLLLYSAGHATLTIIAGTSMGFVKKLSESPKYIRASKILKFVMGAVIMAIGIYMFYALFTE
ncbi:MAG: cytochrome c biogenesis CcdA family protein, partial [Oscillospiraceae bacterium]